jgi:hypothetical protein
MSAIQPLMIMLRALGYAALPSWPLGIAAAVLWPARAEVALLSVASTGTFSALGLMMLRRAEWRSAQYERQARERAADYERLEGLLVGAVADLGRRGAASTTRPRRGGAQAPR